MKLLISSLLLLSALCVGTEAALAASPKYCDGHARHYANQRAGGNALGGAAIGAVGGAILGGLVGGKKGVGTGAIVGGVGGGVVGGSSWQKYYNKAYYECINSREPAYQASPPPPVAIPPGSARVYQTVNVRSGPATTFAKVAVLSPGSAVAVTQCDQSGWCSVNLPGGSYGWVLKSLLTFGG